MLWYVYTASLVQVLKLKTLDPFITDITLCIAGRIVCYFQSWAPYRPGYGNFVLENINPNLCSHVIYCFIGINENAEVTFLEGGNNIDLGEYLLNISLNFNAVSVFQVH